MFGFFKKKRTPLDAVFDTLDKQSVKAIGSVATVLDMQLLLCRNRPNYTAELQSKFVRGYLFGFFDAALQRLGSPCKSEEDAILRIIAGHSIVFHDQNIDTIQYVKDSVNLQDDPTYKAAHQKGVDELFRCFGTEERKPVGLIKYFMELE
ncbi:hypothetical protein [Undibacterium parvum]|jgi:hypothetical protein|uniref:Uncharacterized protein n=2 Tax=Undibacterium TaxID=401469 RepID=A0A6M4A5J3_9BURK|nr:hypothetical protein [Undibacterium parvum]AZP10735.1 hypothetical protein EJN92_01015 [Undibacterium parvum]QJQ05339.1 hypothetical protein EJG51_005175 [Undibacterium piscinae]